MIRDEYKWNVKWMQMECGNNMNVMCCAKTYCFGCLTYAGMQDNNVFGVTECKTKATDEDDTEDEGNEVRKC